MDLASVIDDPLGAIQQRVDAAAGDPSRGSGGVDWGLAGELARALADDPRGFAAVPLLTSRSFNLGQMRNHTLVRYRGMVQVPYTCRAHALTHKPRARARAKTHSRTNTHPYNARGARPHTHTRTNTPIQDMFEPEYFVSAHEEVRDSKRRCVPHNMRPQ